MKNKSLVKEKYLAQGKFQFNGHWFADPQKDPQMFASSDALRKIQNRNRKKR